MGFGAGVALGRGMMVAFALAALARAGAPIVVFAVEQPPIIAARASRVIRVRAIIDGRW
jgi:hypothetical protein